MANLTAEGFVALAALAWADGEIRGSEREGLLKAAEGIDAEGRAKVERALAERGDLASFAPGDMSEWERVLTYAIGCWLCRLDGIVSTEEHEALRKLAKALDLSATVTERAGIAALELYVLPEGARPARFDFDKLESLVKARLPQLAPQS
jgi:uncharacterized membrane protein YebE (DUF533 family)